MFFTAYTTLKGVKKPEKRPVIFSFNGGPGSSSVWLHLGILGPHRAATDEMGNSPPPPYALVDNEHTLLAESDLVSSIPSARVIRGWSRARRSRNFASTSAISTRSGSSFASTRALRPLGSPKYLIGESYGTTRAAGLSLHLQEKHDIFLNGIMLVSRSRSADAVIRPGQRTLPYALFLPTCAATAWHHMALAPDLQKKSLREVVGLAEPLRSSEYSVALPAGSRLSPAKRKRCRPPGGAFLRLVGRVVSAATFVRTNSGSSRSCCAIAA